MSISGPHLGSAFLGDATRHRVLSPPSSPRRPGAPATPPISPTLAAAMQSLAMPPAADQKDEPEAALPTIDPELSLHLRMRWLEALLLGVKQDVKQSKQKQESPGTVLRKSEEIQSRLQGILEQNEGIRKFMARYDQHAQYLNPSFALSGSTTAPSYTEMSSEELDVLLSEMDAEIRAADRDLREIEQLEKRDVLSAGKLPEYEALLPRLQALSQAHQEDLELAASLEKRIAKLLERYTGHVDVLSELFVEWDEVITNAEDRVTKLERDRAEKRKLGYE